MKADDRKSLATPPPSASRAVSTGGRLRSLSIRARLAIWYTTAFALLLIVALGAGYVTLASTTMDDVDGFLLETAGGVGSALREALPATAGRRSGVAGGIGEGERRIVERVLADYEFDEIGVALFVDNAPANAGSANLTRMEVSGRPARKFGGTADRSRVMGVAGAALRNMRPETASFDEVGERVAAVPVIAGGRRFVVGVSQSLQRRARTLLRVREAILVGLPLALLLAGIGGYVLARASLLPVEAMRERAATIGAGTLSARLPVAIPSDELGRLARTFNDLLERIEGTFEQQRQFMADASHELRSPVAVLTAEAELALQRASRTPEEYRSALVSIRAEARRLAQIVDDLFLLARGDASEQALVPSPVYVEEIVGDCVDSLSLIARVKGVTLRYAPTLELPFVGDPRLLRRLVVNVLDNAVKYTPSGGTVEVVLDRDPIRIRVRDSGPGIEPRHQLRVFDRFYRVPATPTPGGAGDSTGAGLGLPIAVWIAALHGGTLRIADSSDAGTVFEIALPTPSPSTPNAPTPSQPTPSLPAPSRRLDNGSPID